MIIGCVWAPLILRRWFPIAAIVLGKFQSCGFLNDRITKSQARPFLVLKSSALNYLQLKIDVIFVIVSRTVSKVQTTLVASRNDKQKENKPNQSYKGLPLRNR